MTVRLSLALVAALLAGCGKDSEPTEQPPAEPPVAADPEPPAADPAPPAADPAPEPPAASTSRELTSLGYSIEVPETWELRQVNEHAYSFRIPPDRSGGVAVVSQLSISKRPASPSALENMVEECAGTVVDKSEAAPLYYVCEQTAAGEPIRNLEYVVAVPAGGSLYCSGSGPDIAPMLEACRSLSPR